MRSIARASFAVALIVAPLAAAATAAAQNGPPSFVQPGGPPSFVQPGFGVPHPPPQNFGQSPFGGPPLCADHFGRTMPCPQPFGGELGGPSSFVQPGSRPGQFGFRDFGFGQGGRGIGGLFQTPRSFGGSPAGGRPGSRGGFR